VAQPREGGDKLHRRYEGVRLKPPTAYDERCARACSRDEAGLGYRSSSGDALSVKEGLVADEAFTRATWRPGKHRKLRKRVKPWGGRKVAPAAFIETGKQFGFKPGRPGYRICSATKRDGSPCGRLALKGFKVCEAHGGLRMLARQGKLQSTGRTAAFRAAAVEGRSPPAPAELIQLTVYRQANQSTRIRLARAWGTPAWMALVRQIQAQGI
jgi:hypothetical protein